MTYVVEKRRLKEGNPPDYAQRDALAKERRIRFPNPLATLVVASEKEGALILGFAGIVFAGFFAVISGMPSQFKEIYGYNDLVIGLMVRMTKTHKLSLPFNFLLDMSEENRMF
jgi:hypothetical protein